MLVCPLRVRISCPVSGVPYLHRLVPTGGGEAVAVGAEYHAEDHVGVPLESADLPPGQGVPHFHLARLVNFTTCGGEAACRRG